MKSLVIIRHAKSSWDSATLIDFERPLNERGKKDAVEMAGRLLRRKINIDAFISSPARRAKATAELFALEFGIENIIFKEDLYHASVSVLQNTIRNTDNILNSIAVFCHNPGITDFVNTLISGIQTDNVPTCGIFGVKAAIDNWKDFETAAKEFLFYDYPALGN